jgi:hypothetical protein
VPRKAEALETPTTLGLRHNDASCLSFVEHAVLVGVLHDEWGRRLEVGLSCTLGCSNHRTSSAATPRDWPTKQDPVFGFSFSYPENIYSQSGSDEEGSFHYFASASHNASSQWVLGITPTDKLHMN